MGEHLPAFLGAMLGNVLAGLWLAPSVRSLVARVARLEGRCASTHGALPALAPEPHRLRRYGLPFVLTCAAALSLAACVTPNARETCGRFVGCAAQLSTEGGAAARREFGAESKCWTTPRDEEACQRACTAGLAHLAAAGLTCDPLAKKGSPDAQ